MYEKNHWQLAKEIMKDTGDIVEKQIIKEGKEVSAADIKKITDMTDRNDHFGSREYVAGTILKDKKFANLYVGLEWAHDNYSNLIGNTALDMRNDMDEALKSKMKSRLSNWGEVWGIL